jgi:hypothetical protein
MSLGVVENQSEAKIPKLARELRELTRMDHSRASLDVCFVTAFTLAAKGGRRQR